MAVEGGAGVDRFLSDENQRGSVSEAGRSPENLKNSHACPKVSSSMIRRSTGFRADDCFSAFLGQLEGRRPSGISGNRFIDYVIRSIQFFDARLSGLEDYFQIVHCIVVMLVLGVVSGYEATRVNENLQRLAFTP